MKELLRFVISTRDDFRPVLPRMIVGLVFLSEGIQKFLFPELVGAGRFEKIGFEDPVFLAAFVASFEIVGGLFMVAGFAVRAAAVPLLIIMFTAIITTKIPILTGKGFWQMAHESRTDFAMTTLLVFILLYGAGRFSADKCLAGKR